MPLSGQSLILLSLGRALGGDTDSAGGTAARQKAILVTVGQRERRQVVDLAAFYLVAGARSRVC
jgi:DeoR family glycerol-3-phosphate regulon repressor